MIVGALAGVLSLSDYRVDIDAVASVPTRGSTLHDSDSWIADAGRSGKRRTVTERLAARRLEVEGCAPRSVGAAEPVETGLCVVADPPATELPALLAEADPAGPDLPHGVAVARGHADLDDDRLEHWPSGADFDALASLPVGPEIPQALVVARASERLKREALEAERLRVAEAAEQERLAAAEELRLAEAAKAEAARVAEAERVRMAVRAAAAEQDWLAEHSSFIDDAKRVTAELALKADAEAGEILIELAKAEAAADAAAAAAAEEQAKKEAAERDAIAAREAEAEREAEAARDAEADAADDDVETEAKSAATETVAVVTEIAPPAITADADQPALMIMAGIQDGSLLPKPEPVIDSNAPVGPEVDPELLVARRQEAERLAEIERNRPVGPDIGEELLAKRNTESAHEAELVAQAAKRAADRLAAEEKRDAELVAQAAEREADRIAEKVKREAELVAENQKREAERLARAPKPAPELEADIMGPPLPAFDEICKARFEDPLGLGELTTWEDTEDAEAVATAQQEDSLMTVYVTADGREVDYDPDAAAVLPFDPLAATPFAGDQGSKTRAAFESMLAADEGLHTVRYIKELNHELRSGETLSEVLSATGLGGRDVDRWVRAMQEVYDSNRVYAGQELRLTIDMPDRVLKRLQLDAGRDALVTVESDGEQVVARKENIIYERSLRVVDARIERSLYVSAIDERIPDRIISEMAEILGWEINFGRDLRPGSSFRAIYEQLTRVDTADTVSGRVMAVEVSNRGKLYEGFYFEAGEEGRGGYYDRNGEALGRSFLRFPVSYSRISSPYSTARYHPVLKRRIPHYGVDFAAPTGTPVRAVADGRVLKSGWYGGNGRFVKIRHDSVYESGYAHLSRIASSVKENSAVRKGQVIGYVGSTGLATGPHLHFAMYRSGKYIDPMKAELPRGRALSGRELAGFKMKVAMMDRAYAEAGEGEERSTQVAAVEAPTDDAPH